MRPRNSECEPSRLFDKGVARSTPDLDHDFLKVEFSTGKQLALIRAGVSLVFAGSAAVSDAITPSPQQLPSCDRNRVGMTTKSPTGDTLECHLPNGWEIDIPDPRLERIIGLPPGVNRNSLEFDGWVDKKPHWDPEGHRWVQQARVAGTEGLGIFDVEVSPP